MCLPLYRRAVDGGWAPILVLVPPGVLPLSSPTRQRCPDTCAGREQLPAQASNFPPSTVVQATFGEDLGLALTRAPDGRMGIDGGFQVRIDLSSLSRLLSGPLGLERGERITGSLSIGGSGHGGVDRMRVEATVRADGVVVPANRHLSN